MELLVAADAHLYRTPDNKYWCKTIYDYSFWQRYLTVFESIKVVARVKDIKNEEKKGLLRADGPNIKVAPLPFTRGMKEYIKNYQKMNKAAINAIEGVDCALFRLPSVPANLVLNHYKKTQNPYALEIVADPYDAYTSNKIAQIYYTKNLKKSCLEANGVSYVTEKYLQNKYPSYSILHGESEYNFDEFYSTIDLEPSFFYRERKIDIESEKPFNIIHIANSINNDNKGHSTFLKVLKALKDKGYNIRGTIVGDGSEKLAYEKLCTEMGLSNKVKFLGLLSSKEALRSKLKEADLLLFPTKAEGLPRVIIEAMATGLPVLSTPVNGIPELLREEHMFHPYDVEGFTNKIIEMMLSVEVLISVSRENIKKAEDYSLPILMKRRSEYYKKLRNLANKSRTNSVLNH